MGSTIRCPKCAQLYQDLAELEDLRENASICVRCNALIPVHDWDHVLQSYAEDADLDDLDDDIDGDDDDLDDALEDLDLDDEE